MTPTVMKVVLAAVASALPYLATAQAPAAAFVSAAPAPAVAYKSVSEHANRKIGMVINTLQDILQSTVNEEKEETAIFNKYVKWCSSESSANSKDLSQTRSDLATSKVSSEEQVSTMDSLKLFIKKSEKEIEETKDTVAQTSNLRSKENDEYTEDMQMNTQSIRQIDQAIKHVQKVNKQGGFLQNGVLHKTSVNEPGESSYVLGIMKGLKHKLSKTRAQLKTTEQDKVKMHNSFMATKGATLKALSDTTLVKKISLSETDAKESGTKRKIGKLGEEVAEIASASAKSSEICQTTKEEWKVRQADRTKERQALSEAIRFLTSSAFVQLGSVQKTNEDGNDEEHASVVFNPSLLQVSSGSKFSDNAFFAAAGAELMGEDDEMQTSGFKGVKTVVQKLIASHQDNQKEEKTKKAYCEKEIASKDSEKSDTIDDLNVAKADIAKKTAESGQLADEVKNLEKSIVQVKTELESAGKLRKQETALFKTGSKDRALAMKVLNQAKTVLQEFYNKKKDFLQVGAAPAPARKALSAPKFRSARKTTASFGAVSMVQNIADDIAKEQKDAAIAENESSSAYVQLRDDSAQKTDDKREDITERTMAKAKLNVNINTAKETRNEKQNDLVSVNKQLAGLHKECDELMKFYNKRAKARTFEVSQLRDVMDVVSGSSISSRTGLMQGGAEDEGDFARELEAVAFKHAA